MRDTLSYKAIIDGQEVIITRHQPSNGKGLSRGVDDNGNPKRRKVKHSPVDDQLHALDMLLVSATEHGDDDFAGKVKTEINTRINKLTGK